jgi:hypothetical protein
MESVGFKEWFLVCEALGRGEQSVILRKGGIAEGRAGFSFRHAEFFLFPTIFHEQVGKLRTTSANAPEAGDSITTRWYARVERAFRVDSLTVAEALAAMHILTADVVGERFGYTDAGLNVAFVRVFEVSPVWVLQNEKRYAGCRSWVDLPSPPKMKMRPVVDEEAHERLRIQFDAITSSSRAKSRDPVEVTLKLSPRDPSTFVRDDGNGLAI